MRSTVVGCALATMVLAARGGRLRPDWQLVEPTVENATDIRTLFGLVSVLEGQVIVPGWTATKQSGGATRGNFALARADLALASQSVDEAWDTVVELDEFELANRPSLHNSFDSFGCGVWNGVKRCVLGSYPDYPMEVNSVTGEYLGEKGNNSWEKLGSSKPNAKEVEPTCWDRNATVAVSIEGSDWVTMHARNQNSSNHVEWRSHAHSWGSDNDYKCDGKTRAFIAPSGNEIAVQTCRQDTIRVLTVGRAVYDSNQTDIDWGHLSRMVDMTDLVAPSSGECRGSPADVSRRCFRLEAFADGVMVLTSDNDKVHVAFPAVYNKLENVKDGLWGNAKQLAHDVETLPGKPDVSPLRAFLFGDYLMIAARYAATEPLPDPPTTSQIEVELFKRVGNAFDPRMERLSRAYLDVKFPDDMRVSPELAEGPNGEPMVVFSSASDNLVVAFRLQSILDADLGPKPNMGRTIALATVGGLLLVGILAVALFQRRRAHAQASEDVAQKI